MQLMDDVKYLKNAAASCHVQAEPKRRKRESNILKGSQRPMLAYLAHARAIQP